MPGLRHLSSQHARIFAGADERVFETHRKMTRLEGLGIIDAQGALVSTELPPDMLPDSDTTVETG